MSKRVALVLAAILGVYIVFAAQRGLAFIAIGDVQNLWLGIGILVVSVFGVGLIAREILFGVRVSRMADAMDPRFLPVPGTHLSEDDLQAFFTQSSALVQTDETDWQAWYAVAVAYDLNRDRTRAREAMRKAVVLFSAS